MWSNPLSRLGYSIALWRLWHKFLFLYHNPRCSLYHILHKAESIVRQLNVEVVEPSCQRVLSGLYALTNGVPSRELIESSLKESTESFQPTFSSNKKISKLKTLLVEDNVVNQKVTLNQSKNLGYTADVAANGEEALHMIRQIPCKLVLTAYQMPILDRYRATQEIRRLEGDRRRTIVIALTANALREDRERCLTFGMDNDLNKPISKEKLKNKLIYWGEGLESDPIQRKRVDLAIDWEHLHQISDGNEDFERELLHIFAEDAQAHLADAQAALQIGDYTAVSRAAHHIKGASANVGLKEMQVIASQVEANANAKQLTDAPGMVSRLTELVQTVQAFLDQA